MAYLLRKPQKGTTIQTQIYRFLFIIIGTALIVNLATLFFFQVSTSQYEQTVNQVLELNRFYVKLEEGNSSLGDFVRKGADTDKQRISKSVLEADHLLKNLIQEKVNKTFARDIEDVYQLLTSYGKVVEQIAQGIIQKEDADFSSQVLGDVLKQYDEAQQIYQMINSEFKNLHLTLLEHTNQKMTVLIHRKWIYCLEFIIMIFCLSGWGLLHGKELKNQIALPIQTLTSAAVEIRDGRIQEFTHVQIRNTEEPPGQEIQILFRVFNMMIEQIKERFRLIEESARTKAELHQQELENLQIRERLRASELKILQMQMNPHFLFNTLNMISKTAYLVDDHETVFLLQKTAQLLRYSLDYTDKSVPLARELEILDCYVCLQEKRFGSRIDFDFDLDERFHQIQVPCLILQPLVENAIVHGVGSYLSDARILIKTSYLENKKMGMISVIDNGLGMNPEKLALEREKMISGWNFPEQIGLSNVYMRLKNMFADNMEMEIFSIPEVETEIRILLPWNREENEACTG